MTQSAKTQLGIQSLELGLAILDQLVHQNTPLMLKELACYMGMPAAKIHRYLVSLIRSGYAEQLPDGRYIAVIQRCHFNKQSSSEQKILDILLTASREIVQSLPCSVQICQWYNTIPLVVEVIESNYPINVITRVGSFLPLLNSATGYLFSSYLPQNLAYSLLKAAYEESYPEAHDFEEYWQGFLLKRQLICQQGYATTQGSLFKGVNAISLPFFYESNNPLSDYSPILPVLTPDTLDNSISDLVVQPNLPFALTCISSEQHLMFDNAELLAFFKYLQHKYQHIINLTY